MGSISRRIEFLRERIPKDEDRTEVRRRMKESLARLARLRREGKNPREDPVMRADLEAVDRRRAREGRGANRGEGGR